MKRILITGCSTGFGFESAKHFAQQGHHVYASMRNVNGKNAASASALLAFAKENNSTIEVLDIDVTSDASVEAAVSKISAVDVLINNAGVGYGGPIEAYTANEVLAQLDLNIVGTMRMAKAVIPVMRAQKSGLIIQVSSIAGRSAFPGWGIYNASKWGLEGLSEAMRYELAPMGIDVVIVEPGPFATNFFTSVIMPDNSDVAANYAHVNTFNEAFGNQVQSLFEDPNAPTDPKVVVKIFEELIKAKNGTRPLRTIAGLDFGFQALNDAVEPIRLAGLAGMGVSDLDGPQN